MTNDYIIIATTSGGTYKKVTEKQALKLGEGTIFYQFFTAPKKEFNSLYNSAKANFHIQDPVSFAFHRLQRERKTAAWG